MSTHQHGSPRCVEIAERLSELIDDELPEELRDEILQHNHECTKCQKFVDSLRRVKELAHLLPPVELQSDRLKEIAEAARHRLEP
jgi:negative regulator of sigma E activity